MTRKARLIMIAVVILFVAAVAALIWPNAMDEPRLVDDTAGDRGAADGLRPPAPDSLPATYIHAEEWPPAAEISSADYSCEPGGTEIRPSGLTERRIIDGHEYCVNIRSEGAAGSVYSTYSYATERDDRLVTLEFTLRFVQCGNYGEPDRSRCRRERETFDLDSIVDGLMRRPAAIPPAR